jgi:PhnB protein
MVILEAEWPTLASLPPEVDGSSPVIILVHADNVDLVAQRAAEADATIIAPPQNQFWGDRTARVVAPSGHVSLVASRVRRDDRESANGAMVGNRGGNDIGISAFHKLI